jgi:Flp pilus assembly protein TadD
MADSLLSSEEYDERAHRLYDDGRYDTALATLKDGLRLYPHSVELYVGLGYTQLAREEYVWAKQAFERSLVLDPNHEDALIGLGESLLRFGRREEALELFERVRKGGGDDLEMLMSMGRALYREKMYEEAHRVFDEAATLHGESAEAAAALGYTLHRLGDEPGARRNLRRALLLDALHHEARIYLAHLLYDRGDWAGALREFERIRPAEHWDLIAVGRTVELKRALEGLQAGDALLRAWEDRLTELERGGDAVDELLAELEAEHGMLDDGEGAYAHRVVLSDGRPLEGTWLEIVIQIRDLYSGGAAESVIQFMRRCAEEERERRGVTLPADDAASFVRGGERAGLWRIEA